MKVKRFFALQKSSVILCLILFSLPGITQKTVGLDNWFNHEISEKTGKVFHYTWDDTANSGFSILGDIFRKQGADLKTITLAPGKNVLEGLDVYIIVDPDTTSENPSPNYITSKDAGTIKKWVKRGGVLLLMANDGPNCEFTHLNDLAEIFGLHFNAVTLNPVSNRRWEMGAETDLPDHPIFQGVRKIYMKEVSSISLSGKAKAILTDENNNVLMASCDFGKGLVLAVGDPWLYNEYIGHRLLPGDFQNMKAARNLCAFLLHKAGK